MNQFGWCRGIQDAAMLQELGFDYIECALASLKLEDDEEYKKLLPSYLNSPIPVSAFNIFFPSDIKVVGPEVDKSRVRNYVAKAADALAKVGASVAVLGSGRSRNIPEGWEQARAENQFVDLLNWIADEFQGTGVTLAIEPLNTKESNIINSVSEGVYFAKQVNRAAIRGLADFYHMDEEKEPLNTLIENKDWLAHIHLADTGRLSPGTGQYPYDTFVANLKKAGYNGLISVECTVTDPEKQLPASLRFMREKWM
ncbi:sugar phosphate isomerase/epimerase family protein [Paenibacillus xerothermodurans]|uniref:Sugar phosphate isomerase/epimerase n=1 Tax=Paenibacillus xerothermodurans TaxID=1977292 RepID=A0A2W1P517_PAEXE|nr:sugar phosphate isomerase/epimerase family protein [Paenibacillus xerothermodurans]PZE22258.1 sugar phosphate isomerase/epimerase [Paenibacillus xerothermodurans]